MSFASLELFRRVSPFTSSQISDEKVSSFLPYVDSLIIGKFAKLNYLVRLFGNVDGSNKFFYVNSLPIANVTGVKRSVLDSCDSVTGWSSGKGGDSVTIDDENKRFGDGALQLPKSSTSFTIATFEKSVSDVDLSDSYVSFYLFVKDDSVLAKLSKFPESLQFRLYQGSDYFGFDLGDFLVGSGWLKLDCLPQYANVQVGSPNLKNINKIFLLYTTTSKSDTLSTDDFIVDFISYHKLEVDVNDVSVFTATFDSENVTILGEAVNVSSVSEKEGRIELASAPTSSSAEAGVFATWHSSAPNIDYSLIQLSAVYLLTHLCSLVVSGRAPNYAEITQAYVRDKLASSEFWLKQSFDCLHSALGHSRHSISFRVSKAKGLVGEVKPVSKLGEIDRSESGGGFI